MLAADSYVGLAGVPVHAIFIQESDINACFDQQTGQLDLDTLKEKSLKFKRGQSTKFIKQSDSCIEAKFGSIELFLKLTRTKTLPVFEEKYRLMFYTQLGKEIYWTLSLPMVVTTGASQQCQCLASVMWQCFSTDVFSLPIQPTTDLPWKDIEGMLIAKMNNLPSNRSLTEENIQHLKQRLLGASQTPDSTTISLHQFCNRPIFSSTEKSTADFTFWEWILSIYNLLGLPDILKFWKNGWIEGFLSKETAACKLKENSGNKSGVFLLRFSDWNIRQSQGKDAIYGCISPSVLFQSNGTNEVVHVMPIDYDSLKEQPLANILQLMAYQNITICRYLYHYDDCPLKELFKEHLVGLLAWPKHEYTGIEKSLNLRLEKLEQTFRRLELRGKRGISNVAQGEGNGPHVSVSETKKIKTSLSQPNSPDRKNDDADTEIKKTGNISDDILATSHLRANQKPLNFYESEAPIKQKYNDTPLMNCPETQIYVSDSIFDDHRPTSYDATKTHSLPTVIFDSADESPSPSGGCVLLDKAISHGITQTGICESPIIKSGNSNQSDLSPREQNDNQKQDSTENCARIQLHNMPLIECPIGNLNSNTVTKNRVENITMPKPAGQDYNEIQVYPETSEERLEDSSNIQSHDMKQGEVETDDSQSSDIKTVKMINNYLGHMDPGLLLKAIPAGKLMQLLAPSLDKVPPEWKLKVVQDLEYRMIESQSAEGPTGDPLPSQSSPRRENNHYCDLTGLNLGSPEIEAGLSLSEADVGSHLTDFEQEESTEIQTDWILVNSYFSGNDTEIPPKI